MEVFQVISITETTDLVDRSRDYIGDERDLGLFSSLNAADQFIEEDTKDRLDFAINDGDGAWISAYPKEEDDGDIRAIFCKSILIFYRKDGQFIRYDYYIKRRTVKELA